MSGTPVLSTLVDGLAGAVPVGLRGLLNATANFNLSRMAEGTSYEDALVEAQMAGLAERNPAADVEGHDAVAKVMILSALVFADSFDVNRSTAAESPMSLGRRWTRPPPPGRDSSTSQRSSSPSQTERGTSPRAWSQRSFPATIR